MCDDIAANHYRRSATSNPQSIFKTFKTDVINLCRAHARVIHLTIKNKISKLKKRLDEANNNPLISKDNKMLKSLVIKTKILELKQILFESNHIYAKTKNLVHAETICRNWIKTNRANKPRDTIFSIFNPLDADTTPTYDSTEMAKRAKEYHEMLQHRD